MEVELYFQRESIGREAKEKDDDLPFKVMVFYQQVS
jgi:hypothetical protein